jgi:hypothetical protein
MAWGGGSAKLPGRYFTDAERAALSSSFYSGIEAKKRAVMLNGVPSLSVCRLLPDIIFAGLV